MSSVALTTLTTAASSTLLDLGFPLTNDDIYSLNDEVVTGLVCLKTSFRPESEPLTLLERFVNLSTLDVHIKIFFNLAQYYPHCLPPQITTLKIYPYLLDSFRFRNGSDRTIDSGTAGRLANFFQIPTLLPNLKEVFLYPAVMDSRVVDACRKRNVNVVELVVSELAKRDLVF